jgi:hypothetical protein
LISPAWRSATTSVITCLRVDVEFGPSPSAATKRRASSSSRSMRWKK